MYVVGITACPTGIAHTYMAQSSLEEELKNRGFNYKIETQGSIGIENELEQDEINQADMIIMCVSISIENESRFEGKKVYYGNIEECISNPQNIVNEGLKYYGL